MTRDNDADEIYVPGDDELYKLALTCRTLYQATEPFLYIKFVQCSTKSMSLFLRTILEKPQYAERVRILILKEDFGKYIPTKKDKGKEHGIHNDDRFARELSNQRDLTLFTSAYNMLRYGEKGAPEVQKTDELDLWTSGLAEWNHDALSVLLLFSLPNLEHFSQTDGSYEPSPFIESLVNGVDKTYLPCLKEIGYNLQYPEAGVQFSKVECFFHLPSIRKVEIPAWSYKNSTGPSSDLVWSKP